MLQVARKLAMVEADLERAEERAEAGEKFVHFVYHEQNFFTLYIFSCSCFSLSLSLFDCFLLFFHHGFFYIFVLSPCIHLFFGFRSISLSMSLCLHIYDYIFRIYFSQSLSLSLSISFSLFLHVFLLPKTLICSLLWWELTTAFLIISRSFFFPSRKRSLLLTDQTQCTLGHTEKRERTRYIIVHAPSLVWEIGLTGVAHCADWLSCSHTKQRGSFTLRLLLQS